MTTRPIRVLDLFAGAGGLTRGFHEASARFRTVRAVEMDLHAAASYEATFAPLFGAGVTEQRSIQDWLEHGDVPRDVDLIVGGPPCQGFSTLGKQDVEDARNSLWFEYARTIVRTKPRYFVVENVAAFAKSPQFRLFEEATQPGGLLEDYTFEHAVLNAADFGAYQARKRAVVIGRHRDLPRVGMPIPTHKDHASVRTAFRGVPWEADDAALPGDLRFSFNGRDLPGAFTPRQLHLSRSYSPMSLERFAAIPLGGNRFNLSDDLLAPCWRRHRSGSADVMGRLHWDRPSVTIRTEFFKPEKGRYLHPEANRAITHYEAALLQGFPQDHKFVGSKISIARQIGNAVPIQLGAAIARRLEPLY